MLGLGLDIDSLAVRGVVSAAPWYETDTRLWSYLRADDLSSITVTDGKVTGLTDYTENNIDFATASPSAPGPITGTRKINGLNALYYNGSSLLSAGDVGDLDYTSVYQRILMSFRTDDVATDDQSLISKQDRSTPYRGWSLYILKTTGNIVFEYISASGAFVAKSDYTVGPGSNYVLEFCFNIDKTVDLYINDEAVSMTVTTDTLSAAINSTIPLTIGGRRNSAGSPDWRTLFRGIMGDVAIFRDTSAISHESISPARLDFMTRYGGWSENLSNWDLRRTEIVIPKPVAMGGYGPYFPTICAATGIGSFPGDYAVYFSSDHATEDIWQFHVLGSPSEADNYVGYAAANYGHVVSPPAGNPIITNTGETPCIKNISGTLVMTTHYGTGSTDRRTSTDGVKFTSPSAILSYVAADEPGDGHCGYFCWGINPFPDVPYDYVGYSLHGGADKPHFAQWGTDNPVSGSWTKLGLLERSRGRAMDNWKNMSIEWNTVDIASAKVINGGVSLLGCITTDASGAATRYLSIVEIPLDNTGRNIIGEPVLALGHGYSFDATEASKPAFVNHNGQRVVIYSAADISSSNSIVACVDSGSRAGTDGFQALTPAIPEYAEEYVDFTTEGSLPAWLTTVTAGASPTATFSSGLNLNATTGTPNEEIYVFVDTGKIPDNVEYIDLFFSGMKTTSTNKERIPMFGIANAKDIEENWTDALYFDNGKGTSSNLYMQQRIGGTDQTALEAKSLGPGYSSDESTSSKAYGFRWFVTEKRMILLGEGRTEVDEMAVLDTFDSSGLMYPFFGIKAASASITEFFATLVYRYGL